MSKKIIGVTVGTPLSPHIIQQTLNTVTSINGIQPDNNGNIELPTFNGEYEVTPSASNEVTLLTSQTFVDANIKVNKIPYAEVSNNVGGSTVTIG